MITFRCAACQRILEVPADQAQAKLNCPTCGQRLQVPAPRNNKTILGSLVSAKEAPSVPPAGAVRPGITWGWVTAAVLLVVVSVLGTLLLTRLDHAPEARPPAATAVGLQAAQTPGNSPAQAKHDPTTETPTTASSDKIETKSPSVNPVGDKEPIQEKPVPGKPSKALQDKINRAIDRGVVYLKSTFASDGVVNGDHRNGLTALAAWTLLESEVPAANPLVQKAAASLRKEIIGDDQTYHLAVAIMFLDRLGDPADEPFIQAIAVRLLAGLQPAGWGYQCRMAQDDLDVLIKHLQDALKARAEKTPPIKKARSPKELPENIRNLIAKINSSEPVSTLPDNSNTQFAMLALWVARRHGLPVDDALLRVYRAFRDAQEANGAWPYRFRSEGASARGCATMTCAGLLGVALGQGVARARKQPVPPLLTDGSAAAGLKFLADFITTPEQVQKSEVLGVGGVEGGEFYYFLFSLERMAVVYDVKTIGGKDWYIWGAEALVAKQQTSGAWRDGFDTADTCFALLFLHRANVAADLTLDLKAIPKPVQRERDDVDVPPSAPKEKKSKSDKQSRLPRAPRGIAVARLQELRGRQANVAKDAP